ncbi:MAG: DUF2628 domain-containing protein [Alphaproteobacteria bacterium]
MRVYTVYRSPGPVAGDEPILIREGFSWAAFLFTGFWALWHGLWLVALALFAAEVALGVALEFAGVGDVTRAAAAFGIAFLIGCGAHDWRRSGLVRQGATFEGLVAANGIDAALRRWSDLHPGARVA